VNGNNNFEHGKLGEYICATSLLRMGLSATLINLDTIDLIVNKDRKLIRVQVKSSRHKLKDKNSNFRGYQFQTTYSGAKLPLTEDHCDVIAFVATDIEKVIFKPIKMFNNITKRFAKQHFLKKDVEKVTWDETMEAII